MNLNELRRAVDACQVQEGAQWLRSPGRGPEPAAKEWLELFGLRNRGLLTVLAEALRRDEDKPDLSALYAQLKDQYSLKSEFGRTIRLFSGVAAALQAWDGYVSSAGHPRVSIEDLVKDFGAGLVADVQTELEGAAKSELAYPDLYDDELKRAKGDPLWPWKDPRRAARASVMVPAVAVKSVEVEGKMKREGVAAWIRFDWVSRDEANGAAHVYLAPAQMAVRRTAPLGPPKWYKETSWWEAELAILDYLAGQVGSGPVARSSYPHPVPYALPLRQSNGRRPGGDIRWWLMMEGGEETRVWGGDSFGLAYVLGLVQVLARAAVELPPEWGKLKDEDLMDLMRGVLGMAAVDRDGSLRPVGLTYEKLQASIPSFIRRGGRTIHTVVAAKMQERELRKEFELDDKGWLGTEKEIRFLFAATVGEAIAQVLEHLGGLGVVDGAIRRYGMAQEALWRREFREPGPLSTSHLPPYVKSQGLRMLGDRAKVPAALTAEAFAMVREGDEPKPSTRPASEAWQPKDRQQLLQDLCAFAGRTVPDGTWTAPPPGPVDSLRLLCVTHDAGQGKSALLQWLERGLRERLPSGYWVVRLGVEAVCQPVEKVLAELAVQLGLRTDDQKIREELEKRLATGGIVFLVDGLDQVRMDVPMGAWASLINTLGKHCRWVVAGRPHALSVHWERLFKVTESPWRFLLLDYFTEVDQMAYLGETLFERVTGTIEAPKELLAVPRALYYVRELAGESDAELEKIRTPSDVYLHAVKNMVTEGFRAVASQGIGEDEAMRLLAAMAFEMVLARKFDAIEPGDMDDFLREVAKRYVGAKRPDDTASLAVYDQDWLRGSKAKPGPLRHLAAMNEGLNCGLLEWGCPNRIQWRNRSLQEFFAGYWLARYCLKKDQGRLRGMLYLDTEKKTHDYRWMWRFVAEMPKDESNPERWVWALEPVYLPDDFPAPQGSPERKRSTEMIWRSWKTMEKIGKIVVQGKKTVIERFQGDFKAMLEDETNPSHEVAKRMIENFVRCPADPKDDNQPFQIGSPTSEAEREDNEVLHTVQVSPFMMGKYSVTEEEYGLFEPGKPRNKGGRYPVVEVSWYDAWVFAKWVGRRLSTGKWESCRLATEAEWEYACRAGKRTAYCYGNDPRRLGEFAWYDENSGVSLRPVGEKGANAWGLHDMHGNVWEWCEDWYGKYEVRGGETAVNPTGPKSGSTRVFRGGSWRFGARGCRSAVRSGSRPGKRLDDLGFRLVLNSVPQGVSSQPAGGAR